MIVLFWRCLALVGTKEEQATPGISGPCVWLALSPQGGPASSTLARAGPVLISWRADKDSVADDGQFAPWKHRRLVARHSADAREVKPG